MKGFTLIELMIVVVIIGILYAAAMPQYRKTVETSRIAEAMTLGKTIIEAQNRSLDAFPGKSVASRGAIDVQLPGGSDAWSGNVYSTNDFTYTLQAHGVTISRGDYSLFMGNRNAQTPNSCSGGDICASIKGMGFIKEEDLDTSKGEEDLEESEDLEGSEE